MSVSLNNYTTQDAYTETGAIHLAEAEQVQVQVANAGVKFQLDLSREGSGRWSDEEYLALAIGTMPRLCSGIRFRSAVAGAPAQVSATLLNAADLSEGAGSLASFEANVLPSGAVGATLSLLTGDVFWSTQTGARAGALPCDGALYNADADPTLENLWNKIGTTFGGTGKSSFAVPDLRGRVAVMVGVHASVDTIGESDGVAVANRRPQHRHTPHSHTVTARDGAGAGPVFAQGNNIIQTSSTSSVDGGSGVAADALDAPAHLVLNAYIVK